jgi:hypothetical protein
MAFGKRMRIANAITDLRRPPSIEYSDHQLSPNSLTHSHSRTQSQSQSLPGTTSVTTVGHVHSYSMQSSFGSPGAGHGSQQFGHLQDSPMNINDDMKTVGMGSGTVVGVAAGMPAAAGVGLGIALTPSEVSPFMNMCTYMYLLLVFYKGPPSRLFLSPSNAALKESAARAIAVNGDDEERGHSDVRLKSPCPIVSDN